MRTSRETGMNKRLIAFVAAALLCAAAPSGAGGLQGTWIGVWQESPMAVLRDAPFLDPPATIQGTVRYRIRLSRATNILRIRISNELNTTGLHVGAATIALSDGAGFPVADSIRTLSFSGADAVILAPGTPAVSDEVKLNVAGGHEILVSLFLPEPVSTAQTIPKWRAEVFVGRDATRDADASGQFVTGTRSIVSEVDAQVPEGGSTVVALGDSLTDGEHSDPAIARGWLDYLAARMRKLPPTRRFGLVNAGIGGSRLLEPGMGQAALARFDRDVGAVPGVRTVIVEFGLNDLGLSGKAIFGPSSVPTVTPELLIAGYRQLIARAHALGLRVIGTTLTPFRGFSAYYDDDKERDRQAVNNWMRESKAFDAVLDFDQVLRDPSDPSRLRPEWDSGDHVHPTQAGYEALGTSIDLGMLR